MEAIKEFFTKCIDYLKANPVYAIIIGAALVFIVVILIVIISLSAKRKKAKKQAAKKEKVVSKDEQALAAIEAEKKQAAMDREAAAKAEAEKQAAARAEVEAKLEAQRLEAEREEAEAKAAEEAAKAQEIQTETKTEAVAVETPVEESSVAQATEKEEQKAEEPVKEDAPELPAEEKKPVQKKTETKKKTTAKKEKAQEESVKEAPAEEKSPAKAEEATTDSKLYDELKDAEEEDDIWYDENETEKFARYAGKWSIYHILTDDRNSADDDMYFFELHASNGEKLLSSEEYTTYAGVLRGIETHKNNILKGNFKITLSKKGDYIFKLLSGKNMLLCMGENYPTKVRCESAIKSAKRFAKTAIIDENVQDYVLKVPAEEDNYVAPVADGYNGKWLISSRDDVDGEKVYYFELFANNGEKLLASEEYTTYIGAVNGIQTHKTNIAKGNFRISLTKRGDYIYKLLNGNGQLLCLGEHYKTKARCQSAVESVKRFASNSPVLTASELIQ